MLYIQGSFFMYASIDFWILIFLFSLLFVFLNSHMLSYPNELRSKDVNY